MATPARPAAGGGACECATAVRDAGRLVVYHPGYRDAHGGWRCCRCRRALMEAGIDSSAPSSCAARVAGVDGMPLPSTLIFDHLTARQMVNSRPERRRAPATPALAAVSLQEVLEMAHRTAGGLVGRCAPHGLGNRLARSGRAAQPAAARGGRRRGGAELLIFDRTTARSSASTLASVRAMSPTQRPIRRRSRAPAAPRTTSSSLAEHPDAPWIPSPLRRCRTRAGRRPPWSCGVHQLHGARPLGARRRRFRAAAAAFERPRRCAWRSSTAATRSEAVAPSIEVHDLSRASRSGSTPTSKTSGPRGRTPI